MRFLVDRCIGPAVAEWLRREGHDVAEVQAWGADPGDRVILERATAAGRALVTSDKDFGALIFLLAAAHSGVIRLPSVRVPERIRLLSQVLVEYRDQDLRESILTVSAARTRLTRRPSR